MIIKPLKLSIDSLIVLMLGSALIGIAISYSDLYLFHIFLAFLGFFSLYSLKKKKYKLNINKFVTNYSFFPLLMFFWYSLSIIWSPDLFLSLKYIFYLFCGLAILFSIIYYCNSKIKLDNLFKLFSSILVLELVIAMIESFTVFRMPISPYSSLVQFFGKDPVDFTQNEMFFVYSNLNPPTGFRWNTNNLAITMVLILPFFLCSKKISIKILGAILITTITIMSASRAVFLGLIVIYCLYLFIIKKRIGTILLVWLMTIGLFLGMSQLRDSENPRINEVANSIQALELYLKGDLDVGGSLQWRRELVNNGLEALYSSYGLGLGAGGSLANQEKIGAVAGRFTSMHNFWVELLVEGGIIFAIFAFFWYANIIYNLFKICKSTNNNKLSYYGQALFLATIAFIPSAIAASSTIYFFPMWIMLGMSISVILIYKNEIKLNG